MLANLLCTVFDHQLCFLALPAFHMLQECHQKHYQSALVHLLLKLCPHQNHSILPLLSQYFNTFYFKCRTRLSLRLLTQGVALRATNFTFTLSDETHPFSRYTFTLSCAWHGVIIPAHHFIRSK